MRKHNRRLGASHSKADGFKQDIDKAVFLHRQAAEQGHVKAQMSLAYSYHAGLGNQQYTEEAIVLVYQSSRTSLC